jgi:hypothetical protein
MRSTPLNLINKITSNIYSPNNNNNNNNNNSGWFNGRMRGERLCIYMLCQILDLPLNNSNYWSEWKVQKLLACILLYVSQWKWGFYGIAIFMLFLSLLNKMQILIDSSKIWPIGWHWWVAGKECNKKVKN